MRRIKFNVVKLLFACCLLILSLNASATDDPPLISFFNGAAGEIIADPNATLAKETIDNVFYSPALFTTIANAANDKITNVISLFVNEGLIENIKTDFTAQVTVKIDYTLLNGSLGTIPSQILEISYTKARGLKYNARQTIKFNQCRKVKVTILSISTPVTSWVVWDVLRLENRMLIKRDYVFDNNTYNTKIAPLHTQPAADADELLISWSNDPLLANGKTHIDIEWTWVDVEALENYKKPDPNDNNLLKFDADLIFKNNSTRITIESKSNNAYKIPLLYDGAGQLFYRIRPVQLKEDGQVVNGSWSADIFTGITYCARAVGEGHQENLNWQTTTSFAEEGKRKTVVQYFDGTLRGRQTVTKDNVTNKTVVAESFYDYQGRPTINILPAPTMNSVIKYTADFNKFLGAFTTPKDAFDLMPVNAQICSFLTPQLDIAGGAAQYYSTGNLEKNLGFNKFIPDADGYAYTETRYTPDATGRIEAQGGVGQTFQLGKDNTPVDNHATKYFYGKPDQKELDALFGTEAGDATHYSKNMVRDANGQYSVSYVDMHGRTVATALAGTPPANVKQLDSYISQSLTKNLLSPTNNRVEGRSVVSSTSLIVTVAGPHIFHYELSPLSAEITACLPAGQTFCYDCYYDLQIRISGTCNFSVVKTFSNLSFSNTGVPNVDLSCSTQVTLNVPDFTETLAEGEYNITKTLTVNKAAQDWYRLNVFNAHNICKTLEVFYKENYDIMKAEGVCEITCEQCNTALGTKEQYRAAFLTQQGVNPNTTVAYEAEIEKSYNDAKKNCDDICSTDPKNTLGAIRDAMLDDMTPDQGQYARLNFDLNGDDIISPTFFDENSGMYETNTTRPFNIFSEAQTPTSPYLPPFYANPRNENGAAAYFLNETGNQDPEAGYFNDPDDFSKKFKPSWAKQLLPYHPEFCKLQKAETSLGESYKTDAQMEDVDTWQAALSAGYIDLNQGINILNTDPFFNGVGDANYKATMEQYINSNFNRLAANNHPGYNNSIWKMAWSFVFCSNSTDPNCAQNAPIKPSQFTNLNNGCDGDWNYVWRIFRTLYLSEKERMVNQWLDGQCAVNYTLLNANRYERRFGKPEDYYTAGGYMESILNTANAGGNPSVQNELNQQYADNCESYMAVWTKQLLECDIIATLTEANGYNPFIDLLTFDLKGVCIAGSDEDHPMGSSTVKPGSTFIPASFQAAFNNTWQAFFPNISKTAICNQDIIDFPQPYDKQAPLSDEPIVERKDPCVCTRLNELNAEKNADQNFPAFGNLSGYLFYKHGLNVRQSLIDSLTAGCSGTCSFWDQSFEVPAIFSCQTPIKNCIECAEYNSLKAQFATQYPSFSGGVIYANPANDDQVNANEAFAKFMNNKTGFTKSWGEYLEFDNNCNSSLNLPAATYCDSLVTIQNTFNTNYYTKPAYTITRNADGCDISSWQFNRTPAVVFKDIFNNGVVAPPPGKFWFDYTHDMCVPDSFRITSRIKMLSSSLTGSYLYMPITLQTAAGSTILYLNVDANGVSSKDACDACPGGNGLIITSYPALIPDVWRDVTVKLRNTDGQLSIYIDNILVQQRTTRLTNIVRFSGISFQTFGPPAGTGMVINLDNVKVDNANVANTEIVYNESFLNACQNFAIINPKYDCAKQRCDTAFKTYFNQQRGTNYYYYQIKNLYQQNCNITIDPCNPQLPPAPLKLCGLTNMFPNVEIVDTCNAYLPTLALNKATEQYQVYLEDKKDEFENTYLNKCLEAKHLEIFTVTAEVSEYHYTLYYYDQAGSLVKTVPPAGVQPNFTPSFLAAVKTARANDQDLPITHNLPTQYRYNALNQVTTQKSPDGGQSQFWYDILGRLVVSQNAKQLAQNKYSYTRYDELGRIKEVGERNKQAVHELMIQALAQDIDRLTAWLSPTNNEPNRNITKTVYDDVYVPICAGNYMCQQNLRNRVSYTYVQAVENASTIIPPWETATFYTYDIHGNVDVLLQDYKTGMGALPGGNRYKKITYKYDLISGKVNEVAYQPGYADAFYHRYEYDAENKLTETYTSKEQVYWEREASYKYYRHGPLARTVLGELEVQGVDYAYTLQGWLKGVNSTGLQAGGTIGNGEDCGPNSAVENLYVYNRLSPYPQKYVARTSVNFMPSTFESNTPDNFEAYIDPLLSTCEADGTAGDEINSPNNNAAFDMGQDGKTNATGNPVKTTNPDVYGNNIRTTDAYGYSLNYFNGDYNRIDQSAANPFAALNMPLPTGDAATPFTGNQLFNGNIGAMVVGIPKLGAAKVYAYNYDQLNRITNMFAFNGLNGTTNTFTPIAINDYKEAVTYDANGNILTYKRNGVNAPVAGAPGGLTMDDLAYEYIPNSNKLKRVTDNPAYTGNYPDDIDTQTDADNYVYDEIGNLIQDKAEGINSIEWTVYGKISKIIKVKPAGTTTITYTYDASGNRISKLVSGPSSVVSTYYVRDASGNVMSVYENGDATVNTGLLTQTELHLYGSSRLGVFNVQVNVQTESRTFINMPGVTGNNAEMVTFTRGNKFFELSNHLGNVLVTISDKKIVYDVTNDGIAEYYKADVITASDYYPFGMSMPGRKYQAPNADYRYGFGGQERTPEVGGDGYTAEFWQYDSRLGRRWNVDPVVKPSESPYACFSNNPIINIDPHGDSDSTITTPGGGSTQLPGNATNLKPSHTGAVNGSNVQAQHTAGGVESFQIGDKTFTARYNSKTGDFARYAYTNAEGGVESYSYENYKEQSNNAVVFPFLIGAIEANYGMWEMNYDHLNYRTTRGILKPILKANGEYRSARAATFGMYSNVAKGTGLGLSVTTNIFTAAQVYGQYQQGGINNVNVLDATSLTVGTTGVVANGLSWAGYGGAAMSTIGRFAGYGGMAIGIYQSWWGIYKPFVDLTKLRPTTGSFEGDMQQALDYDKGIYSEWDYYR